jgi:hypothetical protein
MTESHLSTLDTEIEKYRQSVRDDEKQIDLLKDNVSRNKRILKILEEGRVKLEPVKNGNTEQKKG